MEAWSRKKLGKQGLYFQSKLVCFRPQLCTSEVLIGCAAKGNAMVAREAAKRYADKGILSFTCNPGSAHDTLPRDVLCTHLLAQAT